MVTISKAMCHSSTTITANMYISDSAVIKKNATEQIDQILSLNPRVSEAKENN